MQTDPKPIKAPSPSCQLAIHDLLSVARKNWLTYALSEALINTNANTVKSQLCTYVPVDVLRVLAVAGIRDEWVFPVPAILEVKPTLIGYYRLLLGVPQRIFYGADTGMKQFKTMETRGLLNLVKRPDLEGFCAAMAVSLAELVRQLAPGISMRDVIELPLLMLGSELRLAVGDIY